MMGSKQDTKPPVLRFANATKSAWKKAPTFDDLDFNLCISASVKSFFFGKILDMALMVEHSWFLAVQKELLVL